MCEWGQGTRICVCSVSFSTFCAFVFKFRRISCYCARRGRNNASGSHIAPVDTSCVFCVFFREKTRKEQEKKGTIEQSLPARCDIFFVDARKCRHMMVIRPHDALTITLTLCPNPTLGSDAFGAPPPPASRAAPSALLFSPLRGRMHGRCTRKRASAKWLFEIRDQMRLLIDSLKHKKTFRPSEAII